MLTASLRGRAPAVTFPPRLLPLATLLLPPWFPIVLQCLHLLLSRLPNPLPLCLRRLRTQGCVPSFPDVRLPPLMFKGPRSLRLFHRSRPSSVLYVSLLFVTFPKPLGMPGLVWSETSVRKLFLTQPIWVHG